MKEKALLMALSFVERSKAGKSLSIEDLVELVINVAAIFEKYMGGEK